MINPLASCFFTVAATGETASAVMMEISPATASDIIEVTMYSDDFDSDIEAINGLDATVKQMTIGLEADTTKEVVESFNPLYIPVSMEEVDEQLELNPRTDAIKFRGMDGNPYTVKQVVVKCDDEQVLYAKAQYHPFELPGYNDITEQHEHPSIN